MTHHKVFVVFFAVKVEVVANLGFHQVNAARLFRILQEEEEKRKEGGKKRVQLCRELLPGEFFFSRTSLASAGLSGSVRMVAKPSIHSSMWSEKKAGRS